MDRPTVLPNPASAALPKYRGSTEVALCHVDVDGKLTLGWGGFMADEGAARFSHRVKEDGTVDSICLACLTTISSLSAAVNLEREEEDHVCKFAFPTRRYGKLPAGVERGRRRSDAIWEKLAEKKAS